MAKVTEDKVVTIHLVMSLREATVLRDRIQHIPDDLLPIDSAFLNDAYNDIRKILGASK